MTLPANNQNPLSTAEFWGNMVKGRAPIQVMKKGLGEALWREKEKLALAWLEETLPTLKGPLTSDAWLGVGREVMLCKINSGYCVEQP